MEEINQQYIHPTALDERESIEVDDFLSELKWQEVDVSENWLDPTERYNKPRFTLSYKGVPFAPLGGIHGLTGQPGHGKTFTFTQLIVAILKGEFYGLKYELSNEIPNPKVLYIDTEMEKGNTQLVMLRVYEMMGWTIGTIHEEFKILWLREEMKAEDRWKKTLKAIYMMKPNIVFLDGLIDIIGDFNDNKECQNIIYQCMGTASHYGISLWCLLHENPGSSKMIGHAGSFLERKATDVLKTKKDKTGSSATFTVSQNKARARDLDDWSFNIEDGDNNYGRPVILNQEEETETEPTYDMSYDAVLNIIKVIGIDNISFTTLRERIRKEHKIGSGKAKEYIDQAIHYGQIVCNNAKYKISDIQLLGNDEEDSLPF